MQLIEIEVFGHPVRLPDLSRYRKFYDKLLAGRWEPRTFAALAANLDKSTTFIDVGAWIGVTPFWASRIAKAVIAVEPDPRCVEILKAVSPHYPNVEILAGALSPDPEVKIHAVAGFGSSETSALAIGDGEALVVPGHTVDAVMRRAEAGPVFVKIDIEGYEYRIADEIAKFGRYELRGLQCAVHPQLLEESLAGPRPVRRVQALLMTIRLWRTISGIGDSRQVPRYGSFWRYAIAGLLFRRVPKGTDFLVTRSQANSRQSERIPTSAQSASARS